MIKTKFKETWDKSKLHASYKELLKNKRIKVAMDFLEPNKKVLEVGCSFGTITYYMARDKKCFVDGYEIDKERLDLAKEFFSHKRINYFYKNITKVKKNNVYDYIVLLEVIEHIENPFEFLKKLFDLLKPGGTLILSTPNANDYLQGVRNLKLFTEKLRNDKAQFISDRNNVKYGDHDDHLYAWTWETLFRLLNRVGFEYIQSDIVGFRSVSYGKFHFFSGDMPVMDNLLKPFSTNLIFKVKKPVLKN